jgi:hypothetical protein
MAVSAHRITVSTTPVALNADTDMIGGTKLVIKNTSANAADLGPSGVTDLAAGATVTVELESGEQLHGVRSGGSDATSPCYASASETSETIGVCHGRLRKPMVGEWLATSIRRGL